MSDPATDPTLPPSRSQKILEELNKGEGVVAGVTAKAFAWLAARPHLALFFFIVWNVGLVVVSIKIARP